MIEFVAGMIVRLKCRFSAAPTTVTCSLEKPNATVESLPVTADSTVGFSARFDTTGAAAGIYTVKFTATGTAQAVVEDQFEVTAQEVP